MTIDEKKVSKIVEGIQRIRDMGRPFPNKVPERILKNLNSEEAAEVRKRLGES